MRQRFISTVMTLVLLTAIPARAEIIDKIVAILDNTFIITLSDVRKERAIQVALGRDSENDDKIVEALLEKRLFEQQIALFRDIEVDDDEVAKRIQAVQVPPGVSLEDIRDTVRDEIRRNEFTIQRFRPFLKVTEEEVRDVYEKNVMPAIRAAGGPMPSVEQGLETARTIVIADKMNKEVDDWLKELKGRVSIEKISK
jgi:hypothetical protein